MQIFENSRQTLQIFETIHECDISLNDYCTENKNRVREKRLTFKFTDENQWNQLKDIDKIEKISNRINKQINKRKGHGLLPPYAPYCVNTFAILQHQQQQKKQWRKNKALCQRDWWGVH